MKSKTDFPGSCFSPRMAALDLGSRVEALAASAVETKDAEDDSVFGCLEDFQPGGISGGGYAISVLTADVRLSSSFPKMNPSIGSLPS